MMHIFYKRYLFPSNILPPVLYSQALSIKKDLFVSFFVVIALFISLHLYFTIIFETNDDILFSMLIHGYGIAAEKAYFLPASNSLITYISQVFPSIFSIPGYIFLTISLLFFSLWSILFFLRRLIAQQIISFLIFFLISLRPILIPQFTVTAGLLSISSILAIYLYIYEKNTFYLIFAFFSAIFACLLRSQEFYLIFGIAILIFPFNHILKTKTLKIAATLTISCILAVSAMDYKLKTLPELREYTDYLNTMIPIYNYGAADHLIERQNILNKYKYSVNDVLMLKYCFSIIPQYQDTVTIASMLEELGETYKQKGALDKGIIAIIAINSSQVIPLLFFAFLLFALPINCKQRLTLFFTWILACGAVFIIGYFGRPGILRVYFPISVLILIAPCVMSYRKIISKGLQRILVLIGLICLAYNTNNLFNYMSHNERWIAQVRNEFKRLPTTRPVYSVGGVFPYEVAYPVFGNYQKNDKYDIPLFGGYTSAPFSTTMTKSSNGVGFLDELQSSEGVLFLAPKERCEHSLKTFAEEHLNCTVTCKYYDQIFRPGSYLTLAQCR